MCFVSTSLCSVTVALKCLLSAEGRPDGTMCICIPVYISRCMWILLLTTQVLSRVDGEQGRKRVTLIFFFPFLFSSSENIWIFFQGVPNLPSFEHWLPVCLIQQPLFKLNFRRTPCGSPSGLFNFILSWWEKLFFSHLTGFYFSFFFFAFIANSHLASFPRLTCLKVVLSLMSFVLTATLYNTTRFLLSYVTLSFWN